MDSGSEMTSLGADAVKEEVETKASSAFSRVSFVEVKSIYPPEEDIEVQFLVGNGVETSSRDWVGLYKVGWKTSKDYYTFEWAPPLVEGTRSCSVLFQGRRLPRDEASSFQFCYVTKSGEVRGVSTPFHVKNEDFECVDLQDENLESVVLVSRNPESRVDQYREQNVLLTSTIERTKTEYSALEEQLEEAEGQVTALEGEKNVLVKRLDEKEGLLAAVQAEAAKEKRAHGDCLAEKDELLGHIRNELECSKKETDALRNEVRDARMAADAASSEHGEAIAAMAETAAALEQMAITCEDLRSAVKQRDEQVEAAETTLSSAREESEQLRAALGMANDQESLYNEKIAELKKSTEMLQQCNEELTTKLSETQQLLAASRFELEECRSSSHDNMMQAKREVEDLQGARSALEVQLTQTQEQLATVHEAQQSSSSDVAQCNIIELMGERQQLQEDLEMAQKRVTELEKALAKPKADDGALYALEQAYQHAEGQRDEIARERDTLRQQLRVQRARQAAVQSLEAEVGELRSKCAELVRRLQIAAEEYKAKFLELRNCNKQLEQLKEQQQRATLPESEQLQQVNQQLAVAMAELTKVQEQRNTLKKAVAEQAEQRDCMQQEHEAQVQAIRQEHDAKIAELTALLEERTNDLEEVKKDFVQQRSLVKDLLDQRKATGPIAPPAPVHYPVQVYDRSERTPVYPADYVEDTRTHRTGSLEQTGPFQVEQRSCPICNMTFPPDKTQDEFEQHVDAHLN